MVTLIMFGILLFVGIPIIYIFQKEHERLEEEREHYQSILNVLKSRVDVIENNTVNLDMKNTNNEMMIKETLDKIADKPR